MLTRTAVVRERGTDYETVEVELDSPRRGELLVKMVAAGLCHSDDHVATGDMGVGTYPFAGGHEGTGVVVEVGPDTPGWEVGDHVVFAFMPACGHCRFCTMGQGNLCELGAMTLYGSRFDDATDFRMHLADGTAVGQMCGISTFSEYTTVSLQSAVKVPKHLPLEVVCLIGCAVGTGWGTAVHMGNLRPGDTAIVMGTGGIGMNAVQGAVHVGATNVIAVDPVPFKRDLALKLGATHAVEHISEASELAKGFTNGQGADTAMVTVGVMTSEHIGEAYDSVRKGGTLVLTSVARDDAVGIPVNLLDVVMYQKRIQGAVNGGSSPFHDIPMFLSMYERGQLKLDELVTRTYRLDQVAEAYEDLRRGELVRGVVLFDQEGGAQ